MVSRGHLDGLAAAKEYVELPRRLRGLRRRDPRVFALHLNGDCMEPKYRDGDIVIVSPAATVRSGDDCYVAGPTFRWADSEATGALKRVYFDPGGWYRLVPRNLRYRPLYVHASEVTTLVKAVGKVRPAVRPCGRASANF
jgi:phage repressor protein C with HTH and peptisase S24 domain